VSSYYKLVAVAFADADPNPPGGVTFTLNADLSSALGGYTNAQFISDIATLHARGQKVILSVGGGGDATLDVSSGTNATNFANSVYTLMQTYGFDGVDIDLENNLDIASMTSALQRLSARAGSRLIITMAPQTINMQSTSDSYFQLALNIQNILTLVNVQYYNSGTMYGCDQNVYSAGTKDFLTALACTQLEGGLSPSQVSLGLPGSPAAANSGYVDPSVVNQALGCLGLASKQSCGSFIPPYNWSIASVMVWSINVDASHGYPFAKTVGPYLNTLP
jgi:chitinase